MQIRGLRPLYIAVLINPVSAEGKANIIANDVTHRTSKLQYILFQAELGKPPSQFVVKFLFR